MANGIELKKEKDKPRKERKTKLSTIRNKCDALLTPIIILLYPRCLLCGQATQVAHHHIHKSKSTRLRYEIDNLIPLCTKCHLRLHYNESFWASKIVEIKGIEWFSKLERLGQEIVKVDVLYYLNNYNKLSEIRFALELKK